MKNHLLCVIDLLAGAALRPPLGSWINIEYRFQNKNFENDFEKAQ